MNPELTTILFFLVTSVCAGVLGTTAMTVFMWGIHRTRITNADMVRAIGSIFTRSKDDALLAGTVFHFVSGIFWAMVYTLAFNFFNVSGLWALTIVGLSFGFAHGFVLSFLLVATVAEHHPLPEFRDAGIFVAIAHLLGHLVYGAVVGFVVGISGFSVVETGALPGLS